MVCFMMTSSNGNIFRVIGPLCWEFTGHRSQRQVARSLDDFFHLRLKKNSWVNNWDAGHLRRHRDHYDVTVQLPHIPCEATHIKDYIIWVWLKFFLKITLGSCFIIQPYFPGTISDNGTTTVYMYPMKYEHGFVVLCFVVVMQSFIMNSHEVFIHIHQGCFAGTGAIVRLPQCQ